MANKKCRGTTATGNSCQRYPLKGEQYCKDHLSATDTKPVSMTLKNLIALSLEPALAIFALLILLICWRVVSAVFLRPQVASLGIVSPVMVGIRQSEPGMSSEIGQIRKSLSLDSYHISLIPKNDSWTDFWGDLFGSRDRRPFGHTDVSIEVTGRGAPPESSSLLVIIPWEGSFEPVGYQLPCPEWEKDPQPVVIIDGGGQMCASFSARELQTIDQAEILPAVDGEIRRLGYRFSILELPTEVFGGVDRDWRLVLGFKSRDFVLERAGPLTRSLALEYQTEYYSWGIDSWVVLGASGDSILEFLAIPTDRFTVSLADQSLEVRGEPSGVVESNLSGVIKGWSQEVDQPSLLSFLDVVNESRVNWIIFATGLVSGFAIEVLINRVENAVAALRSWLRE